MIITCQNQGCNFDIQIDDKNLPDKPVRISCPKCKSPNTIYPSKSAKSEGVAKATVETPGDSSLKEDILLAVDERLNALRNEILSRIKGGVSESGHAGSGAESSTNVSAGSLEKPGLKKALICNSEDSSRALMKQATAKLGFVTDEASTVENALQALSKQNLDYGLILVEKVFTGDPEGGYKIIGKLSSLPIDVRRKIFVLFISTDLKTNNSSSAFLLGANGTMNKKDINRLPAIVEDGMQNYENLYSVFNHCLYHSESGRHIQ